MHLIKLLIRHCGMSTKTSVASEALEAFFSPPAIVRGSKVLNREDFRRNVPLPAIRLRDASLCSRFMQRLPHALLRFPTIKRVVDDVGEDGKVGKKILLLPEELRGGPLSTDDREWIVSNGGEETAHTVTLGYEHFSPHAVLRAILPLDEVREVPTGYEAVGHIAHFNLRQECLPYKEVIGQVTLDKHSHIRTVVNKTDQIDDTFRFFKMEVLAGDDDMITTVRENGCSFTFDFSNVYWNSRLHTEHERLIKELKKGDVVLDVFAGVGPFSIPAAKKGCLVHANDLNPYSYESLCANAKANSVTQKLKAYNLDGREFIQKVIHDLLVPQQPLKEPLNTFTERNTRIIMNLPATAVQFLDTFRGLFSSVPSDHRNSIRLPKVYCYCFSKSEASPDKDALEMVQRSLGVSSLRAGTYSTHTVRSVAPNKVMMKVTFELPPEVAFFEKTPANDGSLQLPPPPPPERSDMDTAVCSHHPPGLEESSTLLPCVDGREGDNIDAAWSHDSDKDRCLLHTCEGGTHISEVKGDSKVADVGGISASDEEGGSCSATADSDSPAVKKRKLEE